MPDNSGPFSPGNLATGGLGLISGYLGSKTAAGKRLNQTYQQQGQFAQGAQKAAGSAQGLGDIFTGMGAGAATKGVAGLGGAQDYYTKLMSGDPQALAELTGGTASQQARTLQQGYKTMARGGRRSGATAATAAGAPMQLASALRQLQMQGRLTGAQGVTQTGGALGQLGGQYGQVGLGGYKTAGDISSDMYKNMTDWEQKVGVPGAQSAGSIWGKLIGGALGFIPGIGPALQSLTSNA
jgi:hypothetical protein